VIGLALANAIEARRANVGLTASFALLAAWAQRMSGSVATLSRHRTRCAMSPIDASNREDGP